MVSVLLMYAHDDTNNTCSMSNALAMRSVESHDFAYERPILYCNLCQDQLKVVAINGVQV